MRRRSIGEKMYTYSVFYNYAGGDVSVNSGEITGTITDINVPFTFKHKDNSVRISIYGAPSTSRSEEVTGQETSWGNCTQVGWTPTAMIQAIPESGGYRIESYFNAPYSEPIRRKENTYNILSVTETTYREPSSFTMNPGSRHLYYTSSDYTYTTRRLAYSTEKEYTMKDTDEVEVTISGVPYTVKERSSTGEVTERQRTYSRSGTIYYDEITRRNVTNYYSDGEVQTVAFTDGGSAKLTIFNKDVQAPIQASPKASSSVTE